MTTTYPHLDDFDVTSSSVLADPFATYERLHTGPGAFRSSAMDAVVVTRYDWVRAALSDPRMSARHTVQQLGAGPLVDLGVFGRVPSLPTSDPPTHTRLRRLVSKAFTPTSVTELRPLCERIVGAGLDRASDRGRLDVVADIAAPMPSQVIAGMLGVPPSDWPLFKEWSDAIFVAFKGGSATADEIRRAAEGAASLEEYLRAEIRSRRPGRNVDLIDRILQARDGDDALTENEVLTTCLILLVGGNETTTGLIANGFAALAERPDAVARLQSEPALAPSAIEEFLRMWGPVHLIARKSTEGCAFGTVTARAGEAVLLVTGAANRDPLTFEGPNQFCIERAPNDHLAFGRGRHFCLGAPLARLEAQVAFSMALDRFPALEPEAGRIPTWIGPLTAHRVDEVSITL